MSSQKEIGENIYTVLPLPGRKGLTTFTELIKMAGPAFGTPGNEKDKRVTAAIGQILESLDAEQILGFATLFGGYTTVTRADESEISLSENKLFDSHFAGNYLEMFEWFGFCLEVNYSSFLGGMTFDGFDLMTLLTGVKKESSESQKT